MPSRALITCGPSYEPIDDVRRITNFSTGELGVLLAEAMHAAGHDVTCLMSETASWRPPNDAIRTVHFSTNASLATCLETESETSSIAAVFHTAALCDFIPEPPPAKGESRRKLDSHGDGLTLRLKPAPKLIGDLRSLFPKAKIVGWKYELDGTQDDLLARAQEQMDTNRTDACVVNGEAYGPGFGLIAYFGELTHFTDKAALCTGLTQWLTEKNDSA